MSILGEVVEIVLNGNHLWIYKDNLDSGDGALMLTPTHVEDTFGMGESYAHLCSDGKVRRYHEVIGERSDLLLASNEVSSPAKPLRIAE